MRLNQQKEIENSLDILEEFRIQGINHRVLGSLLIAAMNHKPHRKIGDVDVLLDHEDKEKAFQILEAHDFTFENRGAFGFHWIEASKPEHLTFSFLLIGTFHEKYFTYKISKHTELTISTEYIQAHPHKLYGREFVGIPPKSVYEGIRVSNLNPKRKGDKILLESLFSLDKLKGLSISQAFRVYMYKIRIPFMYPFFSYISNIYGGFRVIRGKQYYAWDE